MPATVVIGGQWGDEGKGRVVDLFARNCSVIARYSAGSNAGHTIVNELGKFGLHLTPAGIFHPNTICIIGHGVVVNPRTLLDELAMLADRGVDISRVRLSDRAHVVMPWHLVIDELDERMRGEHAIGTTGTGTGPAFTDKAARLGIRTVDLVSPEALEKKLSFLLPYKNRVITELYGGEPLDYEEIRDAYREYGRQLRPFVTDTSALIQEADRRGAQILLEGAQGSLLDLDSGTYPYVTSSIPASMAARGPASASGSGRPRSSASSGSTRPTRRASATAPSPPSCSTTTRRRSAITAWSRAPASTARRRAARAAAAGSTGCSPATPRGSTASPPSR